MYTAKQVRGFMNKQKLISVLQSRIAKRRKLLKTGWNSFADKDYKHDRWFLKVRMIKLGIEQKHDKQILKQLVQDARGHRLQAMYYKNLSEYTRQVERKLASYTMTAKPCLEGCDD